MQHHKWLKTRHRVSAVWTGGREKQPGAFLSPKGVPSIVIRSESTPSKEEKKTTTTLLFNTQSLSASQWHQSNLTKHCKPCVGLSVCVCVCELQGERMIYFHWTLNTPLWSEGDVTSCSELCGQCNAMLKSHCEEACWTGEAKRFSASSKLKAVRPQCIIVVGSWKEQCKWGKKREGKSLWQNLCADASYLCNDLNHSSGWGMWDQSQKDCIDHYGCHSRSVHSDICCAAQKNGIQLEQMMIKRNPTELNTGQIRLHAWWSLQSSCMPRPSAPGFLVYDWASLGCGVTVEF